MSLRIGTLTTTCRARRGQEAAGAMVDSIARERLPYEIAARLGPSLDREAAVVRLRNLDVRVRIDSAGLRRGALADAWATAVVRALHEALARPDEDGARLRRFGGRAEYLAAMIAAVLTRAAGGAWQFPEIAQRAGRAPASLVLELLLEAGSLLGEVLAEMGRRRVLDGALAALDELGLERLIRAAAGIEGGEGGLSVAQVMSIAATLADMPAAPQGEAAASRRQAVRLWLQLDRALPLRGVWNTVRLLLRVLEYPSPLAAAPQAGARLDDLPPWCGEVLRALSHDPPAAAAQVLERLRLVTPTAVAAPRGTTKNWLASDVAGVLLLCDTIRRLGWPRLLRDAGHRPRVVQAVLVGIVMRLLNCLPTSPPWLPGQPIEPAVGFLCGMLEAADSRGVERIFVEATPDMLAPFAPATDWPAALDKAAGALAGAFAARIRGFRNADRVSVVRHFLRRPGRILIEDAALRVVLRPSPFAVALHVSGADTPVAGLDWLHGRRVEFVLEGL